MCWSKWTIYIHVRLRISIKFLTRLLRVCTPSLSSTGSSWPKISPGETFIPVMATKSTVYEIVSFLSALLALEIAFKAYKRRSQFIRVLTFSSSNIQLWEKVPGHLLLLGVLRMRKRTPIKANFWVYLLPTSSTLTAPFLTVFTLFTFSSDLGVQSERPHGRRYESELD